MRNRHFFHRFTGVALLATCVMLAGPAGGSAQTTGGQDKLIVDNQRVTVREVQSRADGGARVGADRNVVVIGLKKGDVAFAPKGSGTVSLGKDETRAIVVELKNETVAPLKNTSGYPNAFPRPGVKKILDNDRVLIWDYTWTPGVPTPMHFHDKDVVVVYLAEGALTSTALDGSKTVNDLSYGLTKFNPRDRVHTEAVTRGSARAIIVELK